MQVVYVTIEAEMERGRRHKREKTMMEDVFDGITEAADIGSHQDFSRVE